VPPGGGVIAAHLRCDSCGTYRPRAEYSHRALRSVGHLGRMVRCHACEDNDLTILTPQSEDDDLEAVLHANPRPGRTRMGPSAGPGGHSAVTPPGFPGRAGRAPPTPPERESPLAPDVNRGGSLGTIAEGPREGDGDPGIPEGGLRAAALSPVGSLEGGSTWGPVRATTTPRAERAREQADPWAHDTRRPPATNAETWNDAVERWWNPRSRLDNRPDRDNQVAATGHTAAMEGVEDTGLPPLPPASASPTQDEEATLLSAQMARARLSAESPATGPWEELAPK
jgi:hypothetical protein